MSGLRFCIAAVLGIALLTSTASADEAGTYAALHASEPAIPEGSGRIYLYRGPSIMGALLQPEIKINGEDTGGDSRRSDYFYIDRPAGIYEISTSTEKNETVQVTVVAGAPVYVRTRTSMGVFVGHVIPEVIDPAVAEVEIANCDYRAPKPVAPAPTTAASPDSGTSGSTAAVADGTNPSAASTATP